MIRLAKRFAKAVLAIYNRIVVYVPPGVVSGHDLRRDLRIIVRKARPVCLDVGANAGQTIDMLKAVYGNPIIHAFEPSTRTFALLRQKAAYDGVHLYNYALGREISSREFVNYQDSCLSSFLALDPHEDNRFRNVRIEAKEPVAIETIDSFLDRSGIDNVDLLKIDTQGFDLEVLLGGEKSFQSGTIKNVLIELTFVPTYEGQAATRDIIDFLRKYQVHLIDYYEKVRQKNTLAWCTALFGRR
jgi:FkbM family methyltransferase